MTNYKNVQEFMKTLQNRKCSYFLDSNPTPTVSIISSFFNAHKYFEETYSSLKEQTFQDFEWIIVDDCSNDHQSIELFESLHTRELKIKKIYHKSNKGLSAGRNTAISHALGKYLFFMDLDDLLEPTYLEKCVLFLENNPQFSIVNSYCVGFQSQEYFWSHGFSKSSEFIVQNWVTAMLMYRKEDFDKLGGFDENLRFYEDWERWLRAITNGQKCWTIPEYLHCYRRNDSGLLLTSRRNHDEEQKVANLIYQRYEHFFRNNNIQADILKRPPAFEVDFIKYKLQLNNKLKIKNHGKRILCFFPWLDVGGADKFNLDLVTILKYRGYDITILLTLQSQHPWHHLFYKITAEIFYLYNFLHDSHWLAFIRYIIESRQIDIVFISNSYIAYYFLPLLRQEFPNVAFIDYTHCDDPGWRKCGYPRVSCQFSKFLDFQLVSSRNLAKLYQQLNIDTQNKLKVVYTNVDHNKWMLNHEKRELLRLKLGISKDIVVLLFPARMVIQKRPLLLVEIVKELIDQSLPVAVVTLGEGELKTQVQDKIAMLGLESVFYVLPPTDPENMIDFYSASDILLLPSEYEGISLSIYEAMSMNLPVVASDVGGQSELVTPDTGFLVPKGNGDAVEIQAYCKVLVPLIRDLQLREKIGSLARQRIIDSFSLAAMGDAMEEIFSEALALRKTTPQPEMNSAMAEEMLSLALEYFYQEQISTEIWQEKCRIERERNSLMARKTAMETSKFWRIRKIWFQFKRKLRLTQEDP